MTTVSAIALLQSALLLLSLVQSTPNAPSSLRELAISTATHAISQASASISAMPVRSEVVQPGASILTLPTGALAETDEAGNIVGITNVPAQPPTAVTPQAPVLVAGNAPTSLPSVNPANPPRMSLSLTEKGDGGTVLNIQVSQDRSASPLQFHNLDLEIYDPQNPEALNMSALVDDPINGRRLGGGFFMRAADQYTQQRMVPVFRAHIDGISSRPDGLVPSGAELTFPVKLSAELRMDALSETQLKVTRVEFLAVDTGDVITLTSSPSVWSVSLPR